MRMMINRVINWKPEDGTGSAPAPDPASILYPDTSAAGVVDGGTGSEAPSTAGTGQPPADPPKQETPAEPWKEYVEDPAKSAEENAAAKLEHDKTNPANDPLNKVPEDGKYVLTMPDGVKLDQALLDSLSPDFKEMGLTTKQAQALTDKYIAHQKEQVATKEADWQKTVTEWADTAKKDPEIGVHKWDDTVSASTGLINRFGTPELKAYLNASGGGNHPELIRFMARVGAMIGNDTPTTQQNPGPTKVKDSAAVLYPDDQPKG